MSYGVTAKELSDALVRLMNASRVCDTSPTHTSTKCQFCGAPLSISKARNGICKCEWCRAENVVSGASEPMSECDVDDDVIEVTTLEDTERRFIAKRHS